VQDFGPGVRGEMALSDDAGHRALPPDQRRLDRAPVVEYDPER
jgi:hypothetical protein